MDRRGRGRTESLSFEFGVETKIWNFLSRRSPCSLILRPHQRQHRQQRIDLNHPNLSHSLSLSLHPFSSGPLSHPLLSSPLLSLWSFVQELPKPSRAEVSRSVPFRCRFTLSLSLSLFPFHSSRHREIHIGGTHINTPQQKKTTAATTQAN